MAAQQCERLRTSLTTTWCSDEPLDDWHPKCHVVLHASSAQYQRECGTAGDDSVGSTTITFDGGRAVFRRIDLRLDVDSWNTNALPHELTHVVMADLVAGLELPQWLNEGLAMTSESPALLKQRAEILREAISGNRTPPLAEFIRDPERLARRDPNLAYAISCSIVAYLRELDDVERLLEFVDRMLTHGCDSALESVYGIRGGAAELERRWLIALADRSLNVEVAAR